MAAARFVVSGRVQGVGFRAATRTCALQLDLDGSALNQADGTVLVHAGGSPASLDALHAWLRQGPPLARVDQVQRHDGADLPAAGFVIG